MLRETSRRRRYGAIWTSPPCLVHNSAGMKPRSLTLWLLFCTACWLCSPGLAQGQGQAAPSWQPLFNGKDLSGWASVHDTEFVVTNGNLRLVRGMGWLRTAQTYTNFVLELEWRALEPGYDSGIFVRAALEGKPWPKDGWQVNLLRGALGGLVKGTKTVVPAETPPAPLNQWVKFRIEAQGAKVSLAVDGEPAWEYTGMDAASGFIGIQAENKAFEFRNLRIAQLDSTGPADR